MASEPAPSAPQQASRPEAARVASEPREASLSAAAQRTVHHSGLTFEAVPFAAHSPIGPPLPTPPALNFDPLRAADAPFLERLLALDRVFFGPRGQEMPRWVLYDCALAPGVVVGYCASAADAPPELAAGLAPDERVPVSMMALIPLPLTDRWLVHTMAWLGDDGLARATLDLAASAVGARRLRLVLGWDTPELKLFASRAPLRLRSALTTAHDRPETLVADLDLDPSFDPTGLPSEPLMRRGEATFDRLHALQLELEAGANLTLHVPAPGAPLVLLRGAEATP